MTLIDQNNLDSTAVNLLDKIDRLAHEADSKTWKFWSEAERIR